MNFTKATCRRKSKATKLVSSPCQNVPFSLHGGVIVGGLAWSSIGQLGVTMILGKFFKFVSMTATAVMLSMSGAHAATVWDESANGDFSGNGLAPTSVILSAGHNDVLGTTGRGAQGVDQDYFTFTVPTGAVVTGIFLLSNTFVSGSSSFAGMEAGPQVTTSDGSSLLGFVHYENSMIGQNMLSLLAPGSSGLTAGPYSLWVQELGGGVEYGFDFVMTVPAVPEPSTWAMMLLGLCACGFIGQRLKRKSLVA